MSNSDINTATLHALCARIQAAAMRCGEYHINVDYSGGTNSLYVTVRHEHHNYQAPTEDWPAPLYKGHISLGLDDARKKLIAMVDALQRLGVEV